MDLAIILVSVWSVSAYLTSMLCRRARRRDQCPKWYTVIGSSIVAAAIVVLVGYLGILSVPGDLDKLGGSSYWYWSRVAPVFFGFSTALALLPGFVVLFIYRHKSRYQPSTSAS